MYIYSVPQSLPPAFRPRFPSFTPFSRRSILPSPPPPPLHHHHHHSLLLLMIKSRSSYSSPYPSSDPS